MVAGHLREKSGYYYAVLNYTDSLGKRKTKWISTGLTVKGNKKRAEAILMDARRNFNPEEPKVMNGDILFADYMEKWLDIIKSSVAVPTFASYSTTVKKIVAPYFREKEVTLKNLTAKDIQEFYLSELERVSPSSVIHYGCVRKDRGRSANSGTGISCVPRRLCRGSGHPAFPPV